MTDDEFILDDDLTEDVLEDDGPSPLFPAAKFYQRDVSWHLDAVCAQVDPEMWFPEKGGSTREAKRLCGDCLVRADCLEYALETGERFGIWGGVSERERRRLQRTLRGDVA